jgi:hypothetical protein
MQDISLVNRYHSNSKLANMAIICLEGNTSCKKGTIYKKVITDGCWVGAEDVSCNVPVISSFDLRSKSRESLHFFVILASYVWLRDKYRPITIV